MNSFQIKETFVANVESCFRKAGMQDCDSNEKVNQTLKPKYWRGQVNDITQDLFLLYTVTSNDTIDNGDNEVFRRQLYINGQLFTRSGFEDSNFQALASKIENACKSAGMFCRFDSEGRDNSIDTESPIYYVNFEIQQRILNI